MKKHLSRLAWVTVLAFALVLPVFARVQTASAALDSASVQPTASIAGIQGYDPSDDSYTDGTVLQGTYLVIYGTFGDSGNQVFINGSLTGSEYESSNQINVSLAGFPLGDDFVSVTTPFGTTNTASFSVVSSISPVTTSTPSSTATTTVTTEPATTPSSTVGPGFVATSSLPETGQTGSSNPVTNPAPAPERSTLASPTFSGSRSGVPGTPIVRSGLAGNDLRSTLASLNSLFGLTPSSASASLTGVQGYDPATDGYTDDAALPGTYLVLYGAFGSSGNGVLVDGTPLSSSSVTYQSSTQINVFLGNLPLGSHTVSVTTPSGSTNSMPFTVAEATAASFVATSTTSTVNVSGLTFPLTVTVTVASLNVRSAPNTSAPLAGSETLSAGDQFTAVNEVVGENVDGNDLWWVSSAGNYVWSGGTSVESRNPAPKFAAGTSTSTTMEQVSDSNGNQYTASYGYLPDGEVRATFAYEGQQFVEQNTDMAHLNSDGTLGAIPVLNRPSSVPPQSLINAIFAAGPAPEAVLPDVTFMTSLYQNEFAGTFLPVGTYSATVFGSGPYLVTLSIDNAGILTAMDVPASAEVDYFAGNDVVSAQDNSYGQEIYAVLGSGLPGNLELEDVSITDDASGNPAEISGEFDIPSASNSSSTPGSTVSVTLDLGPAVSVQTVDAGGLTVIPLPTSASSDTNDAALIVYQNTLIGDVNQGGEAAYQYVVNYGLQGATVTQTSDGGYEVTDKNGKVVATFPAVTCQPTEVSATINFADGTSQSFGTTTQSCVYNTCLGGSNSSTLNLYTFNDSGVVAGIHSNYNLSLSCGTDQSFCDTINNAMQGALSTYNAVAGGAQGALDGSSPGSASIVVVTVPGILSQDGPYYIANPTPQQIASSLIGAAASPGGTGNMDDDLSIAMNGDNVPASADSCYIYVPEAADQTLPQLYPSGNYADMLQSIVTHEMGHCFGLDHTDTYPNIMNSVAVNSLSLSPVLQQALTALYQGLPINLADYCEIPTSTTPTASSTTPTGADSNICYHLADGSTSCDCGLGYAEENDSCVELSVCGTNPNAAGCPTFCDQNPNDSSCNICSQNPNDPSCHNCGPNYSWSTVSNECIQNGATVGNVCYALDDGSYACQCDTGYTQSGNSCVAVTNESCGLDEVSTDSGCVPYCTAYPEDPSCTGD